MAWQPTPLNSELTAACEEAIRLQQILQAEFEALRLQDLGNFESLQSVKEQMLLKLGDFMRTFAESAGREGQLLLPEEQMTQWEAFQSQVSICRDAHQRNEILIRSKLESISSTLKVLQNIDNSASVEVYDRMGRMSRHRRGRGYEDA